MPDMEPIGLHLTRTARVVTQAFERAMAEAGGSAAAWQVLLLVRSEKWGTQARMADAMGITGATLTHHLNALARGRQPPRAAYAAHPGRRGAVPAAAPRRPASRRAPALASHRRGDRPAR